MTTTSNDRRTMPATSDAKVTSGVAVSIATPLLTASVIHLTAASLATRKMPSRSRGSHCSAIVAFDKPRLLNCESKLESNVASLLLVRRDLVDLREQIEIVDFIGPDGKWHSTRFDFLATLADGRRIAVAVKPWEIAEKQGLEETLRRIIAPQVPRKLATHVRLMTERDAPRDAVYNARLKLSVRRDPHNGDGEIVASIAAKLEGSVTIAALVVASGLEERGFRAVVRCIDRGDLKMVNSVRIHPDARIVRDSATGHRVAA